jgi:alkylation response protein AidB-like acyl-CoA dehydrogenase
VQLLGGYGYMEDYAEEQCMRDARQGQGLLGRVDSLRQELVAEWLAAGARTETLAREVAP